MCFIFKQGHNGREYRCPALLSTVHGYSWKAPPTYMGVYYIIIFEIESKIAKHAFVTAYGGGGGGGGDAHRN